jgi:Na+-transporting NADH:ubiquinone oxidoreductase subunit A
VADVETAEKLGCLEFLEEDLSLCTYACPGKNDYMQMLRQVLDTIEKEG